MTGSKDAERAYEFGPFRLDVVRRRLSRNAEIVPVSSRAFDTLLALVQGAGRVVEKDELMRVVWPGTFVGDDNLTQQISALRKALGDHPEAPIYIQTVPRRGYRLLVDVKSQPNEGAETPAVPLEPALAPVRPGLFDRIPRLALIVAGVAMLLLLTTSAIVGISWKPVPAQPSAIRFFETPPAGVNIESGGVISPDGRSIVYVASDSSGQTMLMRRGFDEPLARPVPGTEGASTPFWSPDSESVAFFGETALKTVNLADAAPIVHVLAAAFPARGGGRGGGTWSQTNLIVYAPSRLTELYAIDARGGTPRPITRLSMEIRETAHQWPQFLPDGRHFLYTAINRRAEDNAVYMASIDSPTRTLLVKGATRALFAPPGYLIFARDGSLMAQRFEPATSRISDTARALVGISNLTDVTFSSSGDEALTFTGMSSPERELAWYDRSGARLKPVSAAAVSSPFLAPDQKRVVGEHRGEIWLVDLSDGHASRFMVGPDVVSSPIWSPDGNRIAFASRRAIYTRDATESARKELLVDNLPSQPVLYDWSSDGRYILYAIRSAGTQWDLWVLPAIGAHRPRALLSSQFTEYQARISPDGRWIAYVSDESGALEVYVDAFPSLGQKTLVSTAGGILPTWRGDSSELFYLTPDHKLVAAETSAGPRFHVMSTHRLFQTRITGIARNHYCVSNDGQRFLINSPVADPTLSPITVVLNWPVLLRSGAVYPTP
jgi:eukaryotic-like serine/threonine-protein kinase